ncbi:hypothetical protein [Jeotgalibacillus soli]|uniref:YqgU-like 6-bladed beta-propeller domain-containing protein n=1 Tax=Jeotgalibacillus soli TaxID=889306 RepID=A0A0C2VIS8_9BACL|nr:hypothetical protein [Jeotgalibacillus soli]KIL44396.1 hypothetical protein KP78_33600 [Jeotgalibacillus soli]
MKKFGWFFLVLLCLLGTACSQEKLATIHQEPSGEHQQTEEISKPVSKSLSVTPLVLPKSSFHSVIGWLDEYEVLYVIDKHDEYQLMVYNIKTGESSELLEESGSLIQADLSPSNDYLLLHNADTSTKAEVLIIQLSTLDVVWHHEIESAELMYEWNPYDESKLLFTAFEEDWSYQMWIGDYQLNKWEAIEGVPPFVHWSSQNTLVYQDETRANDDNKQGSLYEYSIDRSEDRIISNNIVAFDQFSSYRMTVKLAEEKNEALYYFENDDEIVSFVIPAADFNLPEYDYIEDDNSMISFKLSKQESNESEAMHYQLVKWDIKNQHEEVINDYLQNEPISCSPAGERCLYGYQLTSIIDANTGNVEPLILYEEDIQ